MMHRGQIISTDMLAAFAVFVFIADSSILLWQTQVMRIQNAQNMNWDEEVARAASSQLLSPGNPSNWQFIQLNSSSLHAFGLASSGNVLEWSKVEKLGELDNAGNYTLVKRALGLDCCDAWVGVLYSNGTVIESFGSVQSSYNSSVNIDRKAVLNSSPVTVRLIVWG